MEQRQFEPAIDAQSIVRFAGMNNWTMHQAEILRSAMMDQETPMIPACITVQEVYDVVNLLLQKRFSRDLARR